MSTDPIYCDDCNAAVRLERNDYDQLTVTCACGEMRNVRVSKVLPKRWRE